MAEMCDILQHLNIPTVQDTLSRFCATLGFTKASGSGIGMLICYLEDRYLCFSILRHRR